MLSEEVSTSRGAMSELECLNCTMLAFLFGFYAAWTMGIAALAYQKLRRLSMARQWNSYLPRTH